MKRRLNPKDIQGLKKISITKFPAAALLHGANAMMNGANKYGPYNWRTNSVISSIYVDAAMRHLWAWWEGQQCAKDSGIHHLGHAIACAAILLDAEEGGNLVDDRPIFGDPDIADRVHARLAAINLERAAKSQKKRKRK